MDNACEAHIVGQEKHCWRCGLRWDMDDPEPPECRPPPPPPIRTIPRSLRKLPA